MISTKTLRLGAVAGVVLLAGACASDNGSSAGREDGSNAAHAAATGKGMEPVKTSEEDWKGVADALGREGKLSGGTVYRTGFPRSDLKVTSKGVTVKAGLSLGSWAAFARYGDGTTMAMGDLVVTEEEMPKVTDALQKAGIAQTAVHKHLLAHSPQVWWTHFHAQGKDADKIARGIRAALNTTATPAPSPPSDQKPDLDTKAIDKAMGTKGKNAGGIYKFSFTRDETITDHGKVLPPAMGVTTAIGFQPTGDGNAVINGDFAMTADEVQKVIKALRGGGIDIVELHNHGLGDNPRLFYMHFWGNDDAVKLARTLKKAVDQTSVTPAG
ncbi:DUF1259 domain-containing protein [Streptomyces halobius]|uniref:DUF1259 domain-containing protein n=1 Tax=Streptomyces halobius TaxID=2879846 RepID=A0ABY4M403_9ACTN|nr:DUF1259 domain-containing protein [Streptomyces halobius]UQA91126.1 DUF1259 domain-containing protein [Streptomyces halobius]